MPAISTGLAVALAATAASSAVGSTMAKKGANAQAKAATSAAGLEHDSAQQALDFQKQQYGNSQQLQAPFLNAGYSGLANLESLMGLPVSGTEQQFDPGTGKYSGTTQLSSLVNPALGAPGSLLAPWTQKFEAPTNVTEKNDPGYQFRLNEGMRALQNSATAKGTLLNGGTAADIQGFGQDYASNEYDKVYNRAFQNYSTQYNIFKQNQADIYNKLAATAGGGQVAASTLGNQGQQFANNSGNILLTSAQQQAQQMNNAAAATASGYAGVANSINSGLSSVGDLGMLSWNPGGIFGKKG